MESIGLGPEFRAACEKHYAQLKEEGKKGGWGIDQAHMRAAEEYAQHWKQEDYELHREKELIKHKLEHGRKARAARLAAPTKKAKAAAVATAVHGSEGAHVTVDDGTEDVLRDVKWVYQNMARLIITAPNGASTLDPKVLKQAPSNGAVGLAQYALDDRKAFFDKFVTKILPKDDGTSGAVSDEAKLAELDPNFTELEKYMRRLQQ